LARILNFSDGIYILARNSIHCSHFSSSGIEVTGKVLVRHYSNEEDFKVAIKLMERMAVDFSKEYYHWWKKKTKIENQVINNVVNQNWGKSFPEKPKKGGLSAKYYSNRYDYYG
jgi:hypothetical protein